jgi:PRTRC genetic system protein C
MRRRFVYDGREFPDPDSALSVEEVRRQMAEHFPELANAETREEKRGDDVFYTFSKRIGTKGRSRALGAGASVSPSRQGQFRQERVLRGADLAAIIRSVPEKRLRVFELAAELLGADGQLDLEAAADREPELNLAIAEAKGYAGATEAAVEALRRLPAR